MHFYVAVFSAGTGVEILINMVAAIALYMKVSLILVAPYLGQLLRIPCTSILTNY